jgi:hypothetical protein
MGGGAPVGAARAAPTGEKIAPGIKVVAITKVKVPPASFKKP